MDRLNRLTHSELMELPISSLKLSLRKSYLWPLIERVKAELCKRRIEIKPHFWISDEWFTPDGITGVAIPFYLLHPRLIELEREQMGYVEGESKIEALKILRHELGHVIDNAYGLRRNRTRQEIFGRSSISYPGGYTFKPFSKSFVKNLADGYAQGHPVEDFAETFAIWLNPRSNWKQSYRDWPAMKKLICVDQLMKDLGDQRPTLINKEIYLPMSENDKSLKSFYRRRRKKDGLVFDAFWNRTPIEKGAVRTHRKELCKEVSLRSGHPQYLINTMINEFLTSENQQVKNNVTGKDDLSYYLTKKINDFVKEGRHIIAL